MNNNLFEKIYFILHNNSIKMILILIILIIVIAIGVTVVMLTTGKTDITKITLSDIKKGLKSGISSVTSGEGLCPDGKILFNNNCYLKKRNTDCGTFQIPDSSTKFTTCRNLDESGKKQKCINQGKIFYNNKCLPKVDKQYCLNQGSFMKPDPETNETSCTEMSSDDIKNMCDRTEVFYQGKCTRKLTENDCSEKLFLELDQTTKNTKCKNISNYKKNEICQRSNKILYNNKCMDIYDDYYCKVNSTWEHPNEKIFYAYADKDTNSTTCRSPTKQEKISQCTNKGYNYDEANDKCLCPAGTEIRNGKCLSIKTKELCFPKETATTEVANFRKPDPNDKLGCTDMNEQEKKDYCDKYNKISISELGYNCKNKCEMRIYSKEKATCNVNSYTYTDPITNQETQYDWDNCGDLEYAKKAKKKLIKSVNNQDCLNSCEMRSWSNERTTCDVDPFTYTDPKTLQETEYKWDFCDSTTTPASTPATYNIDTEFTYRNNKCMGTFTAEECKTDLTLPNYKNNQFYDSIFYKKPDESKDNTQCRLMTKAEEEIECKKPENNALWIDNKCIKKLSKPIITLISASTNKVIVNLKENSIDNYLDYSLFYKIVKYDLSYPNNWIYKQIKFDKINKEDNSFNFSIDKLEHNNKYKIIAKLIHNVYNNKDNILETPNSAEIEADTLCDTTIYTDSYCKTKEGKILGPSKFDKYGVIDNDKKDSSAVNKWPYIKIPNKDSGGNACGCKDFDNDLERSEWCKENIYSDFDFSNGRSVIIENDKCKISPVPVGPIDIIQASGLNVNQTIKNDIALEPQFYRTDYPYRIKLYWEYPLDSIRKSGNEDDSIPYRYKIERKKKLDFKWKIIHYYDLSNEVDYVNLKIFKDSSNNNFYNVYSEDSTIKFLNCKTNCSPNSVDGNKLYCNKDDDTKIKCFSQSEFDKYYKEQKQLNETFSSSTKPSKEILEKFIRFIWIDGDYGLKSLFKPSEISNYNNETEKLEPNTEYLYRITPINDAGEGLVSKVVNAITITERIDIAECSAMQKDNLNDDLVDIGFNGFPKVSNSDQTKCVEMGVTKRNDLCSQLNIIRDEIAYPGKYDNINKKCVPLLDFELPDAPILKDTLSTKNSIKFTIQPPTKIGSPSFNAYLIEWKNLSTNKKGRLVFNENFSKNYNELTVISNLSEQYTIFPSQSWSDSLTQMNHLSEIKVIHKYDENGDLLTPDTEFKYSVKCISQSELWDDAPSDITTILDGGSSRKGISNKSELTLRTKKSIPIDNPSLSKILEPTYNKIFINLSKFPRGKKGSKSVSIIKYKIVRTRYNMTTGKSDSNTKKEYIIDFSSSSTYPTFQLIRNSVVTNIPNNENNNYFYIKNVDEFDTGIPSVNKDLLFEDRDDILPFTKYNYKIYSMNNNDFTVNGGNQKLWSERYNNIDILTPMKNHISNFEITQDIILKNKTKAQSNQDPRYGYVTISNENLIDPNIQNYQDYTNVYTSTNNNVTFILKYIENGFEQSQTKFVSIDTSNNVNSSFKLPLNTPFNIKIKCEFYGIRNIPGRTSSNIYSVGNKTFTNKQITSDEVGITDENSCLVYSDTVENLYQVPLYYNPTTKLCQSRKIQENQNSKNKLNEYCASQVANSEWWGQGEVNPCQIPQNGSWTEISLAPEYTSICRDSTNKIKGDTRICLNTGGAAFKTIKKWKYNEPKFGGIPVDPSGNLTKSNDGLEAYLFEECSATNNTGLENCGTYCANRYGSLTANGLSQTGLSDANMNGNSYCSRGDMNPATKLTFHNCEVCGNPAGPEQGKEWIETTTCIDGYNGPDLNVIDCKYVMSDVSGTTITVENTPTNSTFQKNKWYQCKGMGATPYETMDSKFNGILDRTGNNFCDPPFIESISSRGSVDADGNQLSSSTTIYRPKYFKLSSVNCSDKNGGNFPLCSIKDTTPPQGWDNNVCGIKTITQDIKCKRKNNEAGIDDLWSCTDTTINDTYGTQFTTDTYYTERLNTGNTKEIWTNDTNIKCKAKCEGPNNGLTSSSGYDKWTLGTNDNTPLNSIDFATSCDVKDTIRPLYQEGIVVTNCNNCNGNNNTLKDKCMDGKYGSDSEIKCSQASLVDLGNVESGNITQIDQINPGASKFTSSSVEDNVTKKILAGDGTELDRFDTVVHTSNNYAGTCPSRNCGYDITYTPKTDSDVSKCRGDRKISSVSCKNDVGVEVDISNCTGTSYLTGQTVDGTNTCTSEEKITVSMATGSEPTSVDTTQACNEPLKRYRRHYKCVDSAGNEVNNTIPDSGEKKNNKTINCHIDNQEKTINSEIIEGTFNSCNCNCKIGNVTVGNPVTDLACNQDGMNKCADCKTELYLNATPNASGACECQTNYRWDTNTGKCVRDAICGEWSGWTANAATAQETRTRTITQQPINGGNNCSDGNLDTVQTRSFSQDCVETENKVGNKEYGKCDINESDFIEASEIYSLNYRWTTSGGDNEIFSPRYDEYEIKVTTPKIGNGQKCSNFSDAESRIKGNKKSIYKKNNNPYKDHNPNAGLTWNDEKSSSYHYCFKKLKNNYVLSNNSFTDNTIEFTDKDKTTEECAKNCTKGCPGFVVYFVEGSPGACTLTIYGEKCDPPTPGKWVCNTQYQWSRGNQELNILNKSDNQFCMHTCPPRLQDDSFDSKFYITPNNPKYSSESQKLESNPYYVKVTENHSNNKVTVDKFAELPKPDSAFEL